MNWFYLGVALYVLFAFLAWGMTLSSFTLEIPYKRPPIWFAALMALFSPFGIVMAILFQIEDGRISFMLWPLSEETRWKLYQAAYRTSVRTDFHARFGSMRARLKANAVESNRSAERIRAAREDAQ